MKKSNRIILYILLILALFSCSSVLHKSDIQYVKGFENREYILKEDSGEGPRLLKKGDKVKLYIVTNDDYIKVYAYPAGVNFLKAERTLILFLLEDDFDKAKFDKGTFESRLFGKVEIAETKQNDKKKK